MAPFGLRCFNSPRSSFIDLLCDRCLLIFNSLILPGSGRRSPELACRCLYGVPSLLFSYGFTVGYQDGNMSIAILLFYVSLVDLCFFFYEKDTLVR